MLCRSALREMPKRVSTYLSLMVRRVWGGANLDRGKKVASIAVLGDGWSKKGRGVEPISTTLKPVVFYTIFAHGHVSGSVIYRCVYTG